MVDHKILKFNWRDTNIDIKVKIDKCTLLDLVVEYENEAKRRGVHLDFGNLCLCLEYESQMVRD